MLLIQFLVGLTVLFYLVNPGFKSWMDGVAEWKNGLGLFFPLASGFIAGGFLPEVAKFALRRLKHFDRKWLTDTLYTGFFYGVITLLVFGLYLFLDRWLGPTTNWMILGQKVVIDQLVFSPLISMPVGVAAFGFRDAGYKSSYWKDFFTWKFYRGRVAPALVMCWSFWGPVVTAIYILPENLQIVVSAGCQAAWSLLFVFLVRTNQENICELRY